MNAKKNCAVHIPAEAQGAVPETLRRFDELPNSALVRLCVVQGLFDISAATVWRRVKSKEFPQPVHLGSRITGWRVGELRDLLRVIAAEGGK